MPKKLKLKEVTWQVVAMFAIAFASVTIAYILTEMPPEQYYTILQLIISFFAGYLISDVLKTGKGAEK